MNFRLDPRTKLFMLVLSNLMLFFHVNLFTEICMVCLFLVPLYLEKRYKTFSRFCIIYISMLFMGEFIIPVAKGFLLNFISLLSVGVRMILPCIIAGTYAFTTTSVSEFVCAMRKLKIPETIIIPCMVVIRFFPTLREDYHQIRNAMALRGIISAKSDMFRHPMQYLEYILIPILMNGNNVAQDLSVAALTKGIGLPNEHTSLSAIKVKTVDWMYMFVCSLPIVLFVGGKYIG